jgi:hypothetical protein
MGGWFGLFWQLDRLSFNVQFISWPVHCLIKRRSGVVVVD